MIQPTPDAPLPRSPLRIAAAQAQPVAGDVNANIAQVVAMIEAAAAQQVQVVVFPEKFLSGYEPGLIHADPGRHTLAANDDRLAPLLAACREHRVAAVVGAATSGHGSGLRISSLVVSALGELVHTYDKQYLFSSERAIFEPGAAGGILEIGDWRLGLGICFDSGFAEHARAAAMAGCHAYLVSALFSEGNGYHESRIWMPARALDNTLFVLMSNHVGSTGGWKACGRSGIWSPYGSLLAEGSAHDAELVCATLDPAQLADVRKGETMLADFKASAGYVPGHHVSVRIA